MISFLKKLFTDQSQNNSTVKEEVHSVAITTWDSCYYNPATKKPYNPDTLVGKKGLDVYRAMLADDQVKAIITMKINTILSPGYEIKYTSDTDNNEEIKNFISYCLSDGISSSFNNSLKTILSALIYGFSVSEILYKISEDKKYSNKIVLDKVVTRPPHSFLISTDDKNNVVKVKQQGVKGKDIEIEGNNLNYLLIFSYDADNINFGNVYGVSDLRAAYIHTFSKTMILKFMNMYLERYGIGVITANYPSGREDIKESLNNELTEISAKTALIMPEGTKVEVLRSIGGEQAFLNSVEKLNIWISRSMLIPDLLGYSETSGGAYNLGEKHFDIFMTIIKRIQEDLEELVNFNIIVPLVDMNFNDVTSYPVFKFKEMSEKDKNELYKVFFEAVNKGICLPSKDDDSYIREGLGFPKLNEDIYNEKEKEPPAKEKDALPIEGANKEDELPTEIEDLFKKKKYQNTNYIDKYNKLEELNKKILGQAILNLKSKAVKISLKLLQKNDPMKVNSLNIDFFDIKQAFFDILKNGFKYGKTVAQDFQKNNSKKKYAIVGNVIPEAALKYIKAKAFFAAGVEQDYILKNLKNVLLTGLKVGNTPKEMEYIIDGIFDEYNIEVDGGRASTIVTTNLSEAFNEGSKSEYNQDDDIKGYEYSAINDSVTTDVCTLLNGKKYKKNNPIWDTIYPPNHFNCRSIVIPIYDDFIEDVEVGADLVSPGFGG